MVGSIMEATLSTAPNRIKEWFSNRTISDNILNSFKIGWKENRIVIPVFSPDGKFLFNKYRRDPASEEGPKYTYDKGGSITLYGADKLYYASRVIICEGELDALCLWSHQFPAVSSTGGAGPFDPRWADILDGKEILILYDNDEAGAKGALKAHLNLPNSKVVVWKDMSKIKDITDYCVYFNSLNKNVGDKIEELLKDTVQFKLQTKDFWISKKDKRLKKQFYLDVLKNVRGEKAKCFISGRSELFFNACEKYLETIIADIEKDLKQKKPQKSKHFEKSVDSAKQIPISNFIKFNHQGMAKCIFHNEDTGSMHYIQKTNKVYCFGCNRTADVIEVVKQLWGCTWKEALDKLT